MSPLHEHINRLQHQHQLQLQLAKRAEPHLTNDDQDVKGKTIGSQEDWFQAHSTQVFLIFGSVLFIITLICLYGLTRGSQKRFIPKPLRSFFRRRGRGNSHSHSQTNFKRGSNRIGNAPISFGSTNGLIDQRIHGNGNGNGNGDGNTNSLVLSRNRGGGMWFDSHHVLSPLEGCENGNGNGNGMRRTNGRNVLWRKTAYLTDLRKANNQVQQKYLNYNNSNSNSNSTFPIGWERVNPVYGAVHDHDLDPNGNGIGIGHKRNRTTSSFGHTPFNSSHGYAQSYYGNDGYGYTPDSEYRFDGRIGNDSAYGNSIYSSYGSQRPISNYIPYNPLHIDLDKSQTQGQENENENGKGNTSSAVLKMRTPYPPNSVPPITTNYRFSSIHNHNDNHNIEQQQQQEDEIRNFNLIRHKRQTQIQSRPQSYYPNSPASTYIPRKSYDSQYQHQHQSPSRPNPSTDFNPNSNPYLREITSPEEIYNPIRGEYTPTPTHTHTRTQSTTDPIIDMDAKTTTDNRISIGSIKFPEPNTAYTHSSTYSFTDPTNTASSPIPNFRLSTQPPSTTTTTTPTSASFPFPRYGEEAGENDNQDAENDGKRYSWNGSLIDDRYSPELTKMNTKLNSGSIYSITNSNSNLDLDIRSPSPISAQPIGISYNEFDDTGFENDNPSPNFPPPPPRNGIHLDPNIDPSPTFPPRVPKSQSNVEINTNPSPNFPPPPETSNPNSSVTKANSASSSSHTPSKSPSSTSDSIKKRISRIKPPSLLPKPKSPSKLRYESTFAKDEDANKDVDVGNHLMPDWMIDENGSPLPNIDFDHKGSIKLSTTNVLSNTP
ncbi:uncharacterized protein IL334_005040 [Kwoniella shivajii]|uniref:Uncharacterized protein n=1 Tax=Kwoniella shivajii TaxID=564305 RepID=A0ABZ1D215_9TREE|nr:hypothetical protein IL334_005040 [Kwoniella shivajii]